MKKKFITTVMVAAMVFSLAMPAMAAKDTPHTITITNTMNGHTYEAYQIFKGDLVDVDGANVLTNAEWGSGIDAVSVKNGMTLVQAIKAALPGNANIAALPDTATAAAVMAAMDEMSTAEAELLADVLNVYLTDVKVASTAEASPYAISVTGDGYYFVKDADGSLPSGQGDAYSDYMLRVVADVTVTAKSDSVNIEKKIIAPYDNSGNIIQATDSEGNPLYYTDDTKTETTTTVTEWKVMEDAEGNRFALRQEAGSASIGDYLQFEIRGNVPAMEGYDRYYYILDDTLSEGLTFVNDAEHPVSVQIVAHEDDEHAKDVVLKTMTTTDADDAMDESYRLTQDGQKVKFTMSNFLQYANDYYVRSEDASGNITYTVSDAENGVIPAREVVVRYFARINLNAIKAADGVTNDVVLTHSKDPNIKHDGDPTNTPDPEEVDVIGTTPNSRTKTFVTGVIINKVDGKTSALLSGAEFSITGSRSIPVVTETENFVKWEAGNVDGIDEAGATYYKLATDPATYTEKIPNEQSFKSYAGSGDTWDATLAYDKYYIKSTQTIDYEDATTERTITVGDDGILSLTGIGAGTYTITETKAPHGYNLLLDPITVQINFDPATETFNGTYKIGEGAVQPLNLATGAAALSLSDSTVSDVAVAINGFQLNVENNSGTVLPETGGMGTTLFYAIGGILILGAAVLLVTRRRAG